MDFKGGKMVKLRLIVGILIIIGVVAGTITGVHAQEEGLVAEWQRSGEKA